MNPLVNAILGVSFIGAGLTATILMYYLRCHVGPQIARNIPANTATCSVEQ